MVPAREAGCPRYGVEIKIKSIAARNFCRIPGFKSVARRLCSALALVAHLILPRYRFSANIGAMPAETRDGAGGEPAGASPIPAE